MLPETGWVGVGFVATLDFAEVRFVGRVDVAVLLPITRVGETSVAAIKFALEGLLTWNMKKIKHDQKMAL